VEIVCEKEKVYYLKLGKGNRLAAKLRIRRMTATLSRRCEQATLAFTGEKEGRGGGQGFQFQGFERLEI